MSKQMMNTIIGILGDEGTTETYRVYNTAKKYTARLQSDDSDDIETLYTDISGLSLGAITDIKFTDIKITGQTSPSVGYALDYQKLEVVYNMGYDYDYNHYISPYCLEDSSKEYFILHPAAVSSVQYSYESKMYRYYEIDFEWDIYNIPTMYQYLNPVSGGVCGVDENLWEYGLAAPNGIFNTFNSEANRLGNIISTANFCIPDFNNTTDWARQVDASTSGKWDKFSYKISNNADAVHYDPLLPPFPIDQGFDYLSCSPYNLMNQTGDSRPVDLLNQYYQTKEYYRLSFFNSNIYNKRNSIYEVSVYSVPHFYNIKNGMYSSRIRDLDTIRDLWILAELPVTDMYGDVLTIEDDDYQDIGYHGYAQYIFHHHLFPAIKHISNDDIGCCSSTDVGLYDVVTNKFYPAGEGITLNAVVRSEELRDCMNNPEMLENIYIDPTYIDYSGEFTRTLDDNYVLMTGQRVEITQ